MLKQDSVLERLMPALSILPCGSGMIRRSCDSCSMFCLFSQSARSLATYDEPLSDKAVAGELRSSDRARIRRQRQIECGGDILRFR